MLIGIGQRLSSAPKRPDLPFSLKGWNNVAQGNALGLRRRARQTQSPERAKQLPHVSKLLCPFRATPVLILPLATQGAALGYHV